MSSAPEALYPRIRAMAGGDLDAVVQIERTVYEFPWTRGIFSDCLRTGYVCRVVENQAGVVAYGIMSVAAGECHILNLCVGPNYQNIGIGGRLMQNLIETAKKTGSRIVFLEVRASNLRAHALYNRLGFNEVGTRSEYYPATGGTREDAIVLAKVLH